MKALIQHVIRTAPAEPLSRRSILYREIATVAPTAAQAARFLKLAEECEALAEEQAHVTARSQRLAASCQNIARLFSTAD
jgi:hypothetical protein